MSRLDRCPFDVEIGRDVRPADELHSIAAGYTYGYYRSKAEDPEAPEHDLTDRVWRLHMLTQATTMQRLADDIMRDSVSRCREGGATWDEIGQHLGISRQAAQQRYGGAKGVVTESTEEQWLVDQCTCGHHITAHAKGIYACRYHPDECHAYRWDEVGIRRVPAGQVAEESS